MLSPKFDVNDVGYMSQADATNAHVGGGYKWTEPNRWRKIRGDNRKLNFHRFPYAIVYSVHGDDLYIKAIMNLHRRPFYWAHRLPA